MLPKFAEKNAIMPLSQNHTAIAKLLIEKGAKLDEKSYVSKDGVSDKNSLAFSSDNDVYDAFLILKLKWGQKQAILNWKFHLISTVLVIKTQKNEWKWRNLHRWQKFYTAAGTDGTDKFQLCH